MIRQFYKDKTPPSFDVQSELRRSAALRLLLEIGKHAARDAF
jgi:hypothetical protein